MIHKMQKKFVLIVMGAYFILILLVNVGINQFAYLQLVQRYDQMLEILLENDGEFPDPQEGNKKSVNAFGYEFEITEESRFENRYFITYLNTQKEYLDCDVSHIASVSGEDAQEYAKTVIGKIGTKEKKNGTYETYRYMIVKTESGYSIAFVDITQALRNLANVRLSANLITFVLMILLFIIASFLSKRAIQPLVESMEKQKQFITDAGHELKTPLAVISANADVLELTGGKNEWIDSIRNQTKQMDELVKRLLYLSKMEEGQQLNMTDFDLSAAVEEKIKQISTIALSSEKQFQYEIEPKIMYHGDFNGIEQMVSVLTENAVKYCSENGSIRVRLYKTGKTIHFEVRNSGEPIREEDMKRLFERFYRPDTSRTRTTGGHGIGLSIAKAVVTAHKGKIYAKNEDDNIVAFCVEL